MAWKVYRSRTAAHAKFNMDALMQAHPLFAAFVLLYVGVCCSVDLMQLGFARRGLLTSNPSEQLHSAWIHEREEPIMDFCILTLGSSYLVVLDVGGDGGGAFTHYLGVFT